MSKKLFNTILQDNIQQFILENELKNIYQLALQKSPFDTISMPEIVQQIAGRQKVKHKIPSWYSSKNIIYPPKINLEQCSSEATALFKASLIDGKTLIDATGGLGVDSWAFAQKFSQVIHLESNPDLQKIASHNLSVLSGKKIVSYNLNSSNFFKQNSEQYDWIYVDPSRRDMHNQRVFKLDQLTPNPLQEIVFWEQTTKNIMLKLSPYLDISSVLNQLNNVVDIYVIALKNEVKEILVLINPQYKGEPKIHAVNLESHQVVLSFTQSQEQNSTTHFSDVKTYVYEPNSAIQKAGAFKIIAVKYNLKKLHPNTHLYTSDELVKNFPGRIFTFVEVLKNPKKTLKNQSIQIIRRNYPLNNKAIEKKYKCVADGIIPFIFTQTQSGKQIWKVEHLNR